MASMTETSSVFKDMHHSGTSSDELADLLSDPHCN